MSYLTTADVAERLGVSTRRVRALVAAGRLTAKRFGRDILIDSRSVDSYTPRPTGRPPAGGLRVTKPKRPPRGVDKGTA